MIADNSSRQADAKPRTCPICGKSFVEFDPATLPFCSDRCQKIDLGHWLGESYGLPIEGQEDAGDLHQEIDDDPDLLDEF